MGAHRASSQMLLSSSSVTGVSAKELAVRASVKSAARPAASSAVRPGAGATERSVMVNSSQDRYT